MYQREGNEIFFGELNTIYPRLAGTACHGFSDYESLPPAAVERHYGVHSLQSSNGLSMNKSVDGKRGIGLIQQLRLIGLASIDMLFFSNE